MTWYTRGMDTQMKHYFDDMSRQIAAAKSAADRAELWRYHVQRLAEFQHERLVHLLVTLFFGGLLLCFGGLLLWVATFGGALLVGLAGALALIVAVTEAFYVAHYYRLENGVQRLYELTDKLR